MEIIEFDNPEEERKICIDIHFKYNQRKEPIEILYDNKLTYYKNQKIITLRLTKSNIIKYKISNRNRILFINFWYDD